MLYSTSYRYSSDFRLGDLARLLTLSYDRANDADQWQGEILLEDI